MDMVPELLKLINKDFNERTYDSKKVKEALKALKAKEATYKDANDFAIEVGEILSKVLGEHITAEILPDGKMYFNIANKILNPTMNKNHELISSYAADVQTELNHAAGIRIKGQKPKLNQDRIDGIITRISSEDFNEVNWLLKEPIINFSQSVVDATVKENIEFQAKSGLHPKIVRTAAPGGCCDWCRHIVGVYDADNAPADIWRRHRFCKCTIEYEKG